jgi:hypothetical protein
MRFIYYAVRLYDDGKISEKQIPEVVERMRRYTNIHPPTTSLKDELEAALEKKET